jgi:hypothetical protein
MSKDREDPGPFRSVKYLKKLVYDHLVDRNRAGHGKFPPPRDKLKAYVDKVWEDWEVRGDGQLVCYLETLKLISKDKAEEEFKDARLRRRLYKSKERLRCRSKKSATKTSSG